MRTLLLAFVAFIVIPAIQETSKEPVKVCSKTRVHCEHRA